MTKLAFIIIQLTNVVVSSMLIMSGIFLFSYIKRVMNHIDMYLHAMVALHIVASALILTTYELHSLAEGNVLWQFLVQITILTLIAINAMFQIGIYRFLHAAVCRQCAVEQLADEMVFGASTKKPCDQCTCKPYSRNVVILGRRSTDNVTFT